MHRGDGYCKGMGHEGFAETDDRYRLAEAGKQAYGATVRSQQSRLRILLLELPAEAPENTFVTFGGTIVAVPDGRWFARGFDVRLLGSLPPLLPDWRGGGDG